MDKERWAKGLKVGDWIEDCRCERHQIKELYPNYLVPFWARKLIWMVSDRLPDRQASIFEEKCEGFLLKIGVKIWVDADVVLEDGASCSLMNCCDPIEQD